MTAVPIQAFLAALTGGDTAADAALEGRCLKPPMGCGGPYASCTAHRIFRSREEARLYEDEWRITGLCPDCQDRIEAFAEEDEEEPCESS